MPEEEPDFDGTNPIDGLTASWEDSLAGRTKLDRVAETVPGLAEPTRATEVAARADCSPNFARSKLDMFAELGVVFKVDDDPATYVRNEHHFERLRVQTLLEEHEDELAELLEEYRSRDEELSSYFGVDSPDVVSYTITVEEASPAELEAEVDRLDEWRTVRKRLRTLQKARAFEDHREKREWGTNETSGGRTSPMEL